MLHQRSLPLDGRGDGVIDPNRNQDRWKEAKLWYGCLSYSAVTPALPTKLFRLYGTGRTESDTTEYLMNTSQHESSVLATCRLTDEVKGQLQSSCA